MPPGLSASSNGRRRPAARLDLSGEAVGQPLAPLTQEAQIVEQALRLADVAAQALARFAGGPLQSFQR